MKNKSLTHLAAGLSLMALAGTSAFAAEYSTTAGLSAIQLVNILIPPSDPSFTVSSASFTGQFGGTTTTSAAGRFDGGLTYNPGSTSTSGLTGLAFDSGVIISTGSLSRSLGTTANPNSSDRITKDWELPGSAPLETILGPTSPADIYNTFDAATLSFDFTTTRSTISFQYAFASDEYPEYVGTGYSDAFAFILTDLTDSTSVNMALIAGQPVSVNTVNAGMNSAFFTSNTYVSGLPEVGGSTYLLEYDGIVGGITSFPVVATANVNPTHLYRIDLVIADVADGGFDSAVYIKENAFVLPPSGVPEPSTYVGAIALAGLVASRLRRKA